MAEGEQKSITCPECGKTSHNPNDVKYGYCGNCHEYTSTPGGPAMSELKPGMKTIDRFIRDGKAKSQGEVCYDIANEIWIRINTLESDSKKPVSKRMKKTARERYLIEMTGLKIALRLALGAIYVSEQSNIDAFLNAFQQERLAHARQENA